MRCSAAFITCGHRRQGTIIDLQQRNTAGVARPDRNPAMRCASDRAIVTEIGAGPQLTPRDVLLPVAATVNGAEHWKVR